MRIHAIQTGTVRVKRSFLAGSVSAGGTLPFLWRLQTDREWSEPLPILCWAIEREEGVTLVDSGDTAAIPASWLVRAEHRIEPHEELPAQLRQLGISRGDVRQVILTHPHGDHAHGLHALGPVPVLMSAAELGDMRSPSGRVLTSLTTRLPAWLDPRPVTFAPDPAGAFPLSARLSDDGAIRAVPTPGHTAGHMSVIVRDGGADVFLAGDVTYDLAGLLAQRQQGPCVDVVGQRDTLARVLRHVAATPTVYLPSHDPDSARRLAAREVVAGALATA